MKNIVMVLLAGFLALFSVWSVFVLIQEHIFWEYSRGDFLFSFSFVILLSLIWAGFRFYSRRSLKALSVLILPASIGLLALSFYLWGDIPCPNLCEIKVKTLILSSEKQAFVDPETGSRIERLTIDPFADIFHYYEPSLWSPDSKRIIFTTDRFRKRFEDPVLHMIGTIDVETGKTTVYKTGYSLKWSEWSPDGRYIYSVGLFKDREFEPYFVAIDTWENKARVLRLRYQKDDFPPDFNFEDGFVKRGEYYVQEQAFFLHLNPSGTLAGFEMYDAFGVVDLKTFKTWVVGVGTNRGSFFDDEWVNLNVMPVSAFGGAMLIANVYTREMRKLDLVFDGYNFSQFIGPGSGCNHGNIFYENKQLTKYFCPGKFPPTPDGRDSLFIANFKTKTIEIIDQDMPGAAISVSADGERLVASGPIIYDLASKKKNRPVSGKFLDGYLAPNFAVGAAGLGAATMISPNAQKIAFMAALYESREVANKAGELEISCGKLKEMQKWVAEKHRTKEERERVYAKLNMPENAELQKNCKLFEKYTPDIFVVYLKDELPK